MAKKPTAKELRAKVTDAFEAAYKARGWCSEARRYLKKLGFLPEKEITVTLKFRYNGSKENADLQRLFMNWGTGIIGATKVEVTATDKKLEPDFDSLSYDEAVKKLHKIAHGAIRDYGSGSASRSVEGILLAVGEPLPPPAAVRVTITLDGVTSDPEYIQDQIGKSLSGWSGSGNSAFRPEGNTNVEVKPRKELAKNTSLLGSVF